MPQEINFPARLDDDNSLYLVVNNLRTRLTANITDAVTTIPVLTTSGYPDVGFVTILTGSDITEAEAIAYSGTEPTNFLNAERGSDATEAFEHFAGDNVDLTIVSRHHENVKDAIIAIEEYLGVSGSENFVPFVEGNVVLPGTLSVEETLTVSGGATFCFVTVTGTLSVCDDAEFKVDVVVSGCLQVGEVPQGAGVDVKHQLVDTTFSSSATAFVDVPGSETAPLPVGDVLVFFAASAGGNGFSGSSNLRCLFAGSEIGVAQDAFVNGSGPFGGTNLSGWKMVTGDDANTAKIQCDLDTTPVTQEVSAVSILAIPLEDMGLVENTDYWFDNGSESTTNHTTAAGRVVINTLVTTSLTAGDYILFGYMESGASSGSTTLQSRFFMDGGVVSTNMTRSQLSGELRSTPFVRLVTLTAGVHTFTAEQQAFFANSGQARRANLCIVRAAAFDQVVGLRSGTNATSASTTYAKVPSTEITYTPNQSETLVVFGNPDSFVNSITNTPAVAHKLVNETDGIDYMIDTSARHRTTSNERHGKLLFTKIDDVSAPHTFSLSLREPQNAGQTVTHDVVNMVVWGLSTNITAGTQFTTIKGNKITTPDVCADTITVINDGTVTVSGVPVMINVPDDIDINTIHAEEITTTDLTVTGTAIFEGPFVGVSGVLEARGGVCVPDPAIVKIGKKAETVVLLGENDTQQTTTSNSFISASAESQATIAGEEYAVFWTASIGGGDLNVINEARCVFGSTELGNYQARNRPPTGIRNGTVGLLNGMTVVTGTGDVFDIEFREFSSGNTCSIDAAAVVAWPLSTNFTKGVDYFFEVQNGTGFDTSISTGFGGSDNVQVEATFNISIAGNYIFFASCEGQDAGAGSNGPRVRFSVDDSYVGTEWFRQDSSQNHITPFTDLRRVNLTEGNHTFKVERASEGSATSDFRRGRILVVREAALSQSRRDRRTTSFNIENTAYLNVGLEIAYTPTQDETVLIFANGMPTRTNTNEHPLTRLRNLTTGDSYREDSGNWGGDNVSTGESILTHFQVHAHQMTAGDTESVRWEFKSNPVTFGQPTTWGFNTASGTSNPDTELWMISSSPLPSDDFECVTITGSTIFAHKIHVDDICASGIITQSGEPVSTGTHTTVDGLGGAIILEEAGSVIITQDGQVITISGSATGGGGGDVSCFTHDQAVASTAWTVTHNLATETVNYIVFDTADSQVEPNSFTVDTQDQVTITFAAPQDGSAHIFPCGATVIATGTTTLQQAYDISETGNIVTASGKPIVISGTEEDEDFDFMVVGSGIFTEALTVGQGSTAMDDHSITTASGIFDEVTADTGEFAQGLTVSGIPVDTAGTQDPLSIGTINVSTSLTVSGIPVDTTGGGGGGAALTVKEADGAPNVSNVDTIVVSNNTLTDDGGGQVTITTGGGGGTVSGTAEVFVDQTEITVNHNLGTLLHATTVLDSTNEVVDAQIEFGENTDTVTLSQQMSGTVIVAGATAGVITAVESLTVSGSNLTEDVTLEGVGSVSLHPSGQTVIISGAPSTEGGGGTSLTVEEQDGAPSVSDVSTIKVTNATLTDEGGGVVSIDTGGGAASSGTAASGTVWMPDAPGSGSLHDDEFKDGSFDTGLWTELDNGGTLTVSENANEGFLEFNVSTVAAPGEWSGVFQDAPTPDQGWTIYAKVSLTMRNGSASDEALVGLMVFEDVEANPTTSDMAGIFLRGSDIADTEVFEIVAETYTAYNSAASSSQTWPNTRDWGPTGIYLRARYENTNNKIVVEWSTDGVGWFGGTDLNIGYDIAQIGLVIKKLGGSTTQGRFQFFRLQTSQGRADHLRGANVAIFHPDQLISGGGGSAALDEGQVVLLSQMFG